MSNTNTNPEIYFHVGMGKVASKYLQYKVFPKLKGTYYIPTTKYFSAKEIIKKTESKSFLLSREFDQQLEREVKKFAAEYPHAKCIILFRRHDSWIASQYKRFAKNGYVRSFSEFLDLENDKGRFKLSDLQFYKNIEILETCFIEKPLVLFYDDLIKDTYGFIDSIAEFTKTTYKKNEISLEKKHTSYDVKQIKVMQFISKYIPLYERSYAKNKILHFLQRLPRLAFRYSILCIALLIPTRFINKDPLISESEIQKIKSITIEDWNACLQYAKRNNIKKVAVAGNLKQ